MQPVVTLSRAVPPAIAPAATMDPGMDWQARSFLFAAFVLQPECQRLTNRGQPVRIGGRALDILTALVERPGEVVSKEELLARAWPQTFVDQANLKVNMVALRRALGEDTTAPHYIATVVGRGYRFIAPVLSFGPAAIRLAGV